MRPRVQQLDASGAADQQVLVYDAATALWQPADPVMSFGTRQNLEITTTSLADAEDWQSNVTFAASYRLFKIVTSVETRVRLYDTAAAQTADLTRPYATPPTGDHGVMCDLLTTTGALELWNNPVISGYTRSGTSSVPVTVTNVSGATGTVTVTLTWIRGE